MNIFQLECFISVANSLNFTYSAELLHISQPALSRNIFSLEEELELHLFERNKRSVRLTNSGIVFMNEVKMVLSTYKQAINKAQQAKKGLIGQIKIGYMHDTTNTFMPMLVREFKKKHPLIELLFYEYNHSDIIRAFENYEIDIQIALDREQYISENSECLVWNKTTECAVLPFDHPLAIRDRINLKELENESFILMDPSISAAGYNYLMNLCLNVGFVPNNVITVTTIPSLLMQVACGTGISILHDGVKLLANQIVKLVPLQGIKKDNQVLRWRKNRNSIVCRFINVAKNILKTPLIKPVTIFKDVTSTSSYIMFFLSISCLCNKKICPSTLCSPHWFAILKR